MCTTVARPGAALASPLARQSDAIDYIMLQNWQKILFSPPAPGDNISTPADIAGHHSTVRMQAHLPLNRLNLFDIVAIGKNSLRNNAAGNGIQMGL